MFTLFFISDFFVSRNLLTFKNSFTSLGIRHIFLFYKLLQLILKSKTAMWSLKINLNLMLKFCYKVRNPNKQSWWVCQKKSKPLALYCFFWAFSNSAFSGVLLLGGLLADANLNNAAHKLNEIQTEKKQTFKQTKNGSNKVVLFHKITCWKLGSNLFLNDLSKFAQFP